MNTETDQHTRLVDAWSRSPRNRVGGTCAQYFLRIGKLAFGIGWVTCYRGVPIFAMLEHTATDASHVIECHFWRLRLAAKYLRT